jgi:cysteine synthase A
MRLSDNVGNTPLIPIRLGNLTVWGKAEFMNPGGSVKDRMATHILNNAEKFELIKKGDTLCEATSGNTGIAFAMLAAERGYKMKIIMPSNMSEERKSMMKFYGAELIQVEEGDFDGAIEMRNDLCKAKGWFNCNQFHNRLNIEAHYNNTGIMGCGTRLKEHWNGMKIIAVEPEESAVMSGNQPGLHGIQGIGDGSKFLVDMDFVDEIKTIKTVCAKTIAKYLALKKGLFVGISAGANVKAAFEWLRNNNKTNAITILCDRGERYLSCL